MNNNVYDILIESALRGGDHLDDITCLDMIATQKFELLPLLHAAYKVREHYHGRKITIHILNNAENGSCPEDCHYCAQSTSSKAPIQEYSLKNDEEIIAEAKNAYEKGAFRYCMVFSGTGPNDKRVEHLVRLIRRIKELYPIQVCVSPGSITVKQAQLLKDAGLDRLNHNLNTARSVYPRICSTHSFDDRVQTIKNAKNCGLQICSGVIIGMGEKHEEVVEMARTAGRHKFDSIPVNFLIPIEGIALKNRNELTPEYCLRVLCLFRFLNPEAEIRIAAGREIHLRSMEPFAYYPANSLFLDGYLNAKGSSRLQTLKMIKDSGFEIVSDKELDDLIAAEKTEINDDSCEQRIELKYYDRSTA
jgi:biotin synthase